jgi:hypothetical protein
MDHHNSSRIETLLILQNVFDNTVSSALSYRNQRVLSYFVDIRLATCYYQRVAIDTCDLRLPPYQPR